MLAGLGVCVLVILLFANGESSAKISENRTGMTLSDYYYYTDESGDADDFTLVRETEKEENTSGHYYYIDNEGNIDDSVTLVQE